MTKTCLDCDKSEPEIKFGNRNRVCNRCRYEKERVLPAKENKELKIKLSDLEDQLTRLKIEYKNIFEKKIYYKQKYHKYKKLHIKENAEEELLKKIKEKLNI